MFDVSRVTCDASRGERVERPGKSYLAPAADHDLFGPQNFVFVDMIWSSTSVFLFVLVLNYAGGLLVNHKVQPYKFLSDPLWLSKRTDHGFLCHPSSTFRAQRYIREVGLKSVHQDSSSNDDLQFSAHDHDRISKRQTQVRNGYLATGLAYLLVCTRQLHLDFGQNGLNLRSIYNGLGGSFLVGCLSFLLAQATSADMKRSAEDEEEFSLKSDTFKRLNWILIVNSLTCLSVSVINPQITNPLFLLPPLATLWNALQGHLYGGIIGWIPSRHVCAIFTDMHDGWVSTKSIIKRIQRKSWAYMALGCIIGSMLVVKFKQTLLSMVLGLARHTDYNSFALASQVSRLARLMVLGGLIFTLKDAADRNVLWQAPHWQINALVAVDLASLTGYLWSPGVKVLSLSYALGGASIFFAVITGYNGILGCTRAKH